MRTRSISWYSAFFFVFLALVAMLEPAGALFAQSNYGAISGQVRDASGAAIPGVTIKIRDVGTNAAVTVTTSADGLFTAPGLRPVTYDVTAEMQGFKTSTISGLKVDTALVSTADFTLQVGSLSEVVTVTGAAPLIQAEQGALSQTIVGRSISDIPLNGRNTLELALTLPGVTGNAGSEFTDQYINVPIPGREIIINGGRAGSSQFYADGMNVTTVGLARTAVSFSPDTIAEFTVMQSQYSAQYSQAGGGIIMQTTKSGTNDLHGSAFWFHREKAFTANPFESTRSAIFKYDNRAPLRRQQLGVTVGGPVWLPKIFNGRNNTFFFASFEPTRQVSGNIGGSYERVPTDLELQGDFSRSYTYDSAGTARPWPQLYNHFTRDSNGTLRYLTNPLYDKSKAIDLSNPLYAYVNFPLFNPNDPDPNRVGRVLKDASGVSYLNPAAIALARAMYPKPNIDMITSGSNAGANYAYFRQGYTRDNRYTIRIDRRLTDTQQVNVRYTFQPLYGDRYFRPLGEPGTSETSKSRQLLLNWTGSLRPRVINELRAGYVFGNFATNFPSDLLAENPAFKYLDLGGAGRGTISSLAFGAPLFFSPTAPANNQINWGPLGLNGVQNIGRSTEHNYSLTDDLSCTRGKSILKAGFSAGHSQYNGAASGYGYLAGGRYNFRPAETADAMGCSAPYGPGSPPAGCRNATARTGDSLASFLLGTPDYLFAYDNIAAPYYYRWKNLGGYVQTDWKVRPNVTLNIGLRYQYQSPRWEKYNRQGQLNLNRMEPNPFVKDAAGNPIPSPVFEFAGYAGRSRYLTPPQKANLEPRFSFAWSPGFDWNQNERFVARGGYGITHAGNTGRTRMPFPNLGGKLDAFRAYNFVYGTTDVSNPSNFGGCGYALCDSSIPGQFGYNNVQYVTDPALFVLPSDGVLHPATTARQVTSHDARWAMTGFVFDPNYKTPMVQNWSFELQYEFMRNTVATVGYQGSRGTHLFNSPHDINVNPFTGAKVYPGYDGQKGGRIILLDETGSNSVYHAGKIDVERRFARGLQFRANYTWSKSIDNSSGGIMYDFNNLAGQDRSAESIKYNPPQNSWGTTSERSLSSYDARHVFNFTALYDLPLGKGRRFVNRGGALNNLLGGWSVNGLSRIRSGQPTYLDLGNSNNVGLGTDTGLGNPRPDIIAGVPLKNPDWTPQNSMSVPYLNPRAFAVPEPGRFGNAARNLNFAMPWLKNFDASVFKNISPFKNERRYFQLRVEFFNVLNMKSFGFNTTTSLFSSLRQNVAGQPNRYANLRTPGVWDAIIKQDPSGLSGPRKADGSYDASAPSEQLGGMFSPLGVYYDLVNSFNRGSLYVLGSNSVNTIAPRIVQFAIKFYF